MNDTKMVRVAALAGLAFFVLIIVSGPVLTSSTPNLSDSATKIFNFYKNHQSNLKAAAVLFGLAMSAVLIWVSGAWRALRKAEGGTPGLAVTALVGVALASAMTVAAAAIEATTALRVGDLGLSGARFFFTLSQFTRAGTLFGLLVLIAATAAISLQTGLFARWFNVVSIVLVLVSVAGAFGVAYASDTVQTLTAVGLTLDSLWILVFSIYLWRKPELAIS
jgi:hypothetical protein